MGGATTTATMTTTARDHAPPSAPASPTSPTAAPVTKQMSPFSEHEAVLTGVVALAQLFATCVEAFGLINPNHKWEREEQLLLSRLGLQQARLLIWGDVVGITSPPPSVTDRAVPKHPSAAYPDLKEPTFFGPRDERLDAPDSRREIEKALSALVDRASGASREEMMEQFGLRPPKKGVIEYTSPVDMNRLEAFRERYELLKEVAESYAQLNVRRNRSLINSTSWQIADNAKFDSYLKLTQEKIDFLIELMGVKERVDRAMRMDIKALGWHLTADRARVALDVSKLKLLREHCSQQYPEYVDATDTALANIDRERKENVGQYNPYAPPTGLTGHAAPATKKEKAPKMHANGANENGAPHHGKKGGLFGGLLRGLGKKSRDQSHALRSKSVSAASPSHSQVAPTKDDPARALSDAGPLRSGSEDSDAHTDLVPQRSKSVGGDPHDLSHFPTQDAEAGGQGRGESTVDNTANASFSSSADDTSAGAGGYPMDRFRSKSIGDVLEIRPEYGDDEEEVRERLERLTTLEKAEEGRGDGEGEGGLLDRTETMGSAVSRHDQYHGLGRQGTKGQ